MSWNWMVLSSWRAAAALAAWPSPCALENQKGLEKRQEVKKPLFCRLTRRKAEGFGSVFFHFQAKRHCQAKPSDILMPTPVFGSCYHQGKQTTDLFTIAKLMSALAEETELVFGSLATLSRASHCMSNGSWPTKRPTAVEFSQLSTSDSCASEGPADLWGRQSLSRLATPSARGAAWGLQLRVHPKDFFMHSKQMRKL